MSVLKVDIISKSKVTLSETFRQTNTQGETKGERKAKEMSQHFTGNVETILLVDTGFFAVCAIGMWLWKWFTSREHIKHTILTYNTLSLIVRSMLGLMVLFKFTLTTRADLVPYMWIRWLAYLLIFGTCGITHAISEFSLQLHYFQRWVVSACLAACFGFIWFAAASIESDQRIIALSFAALPYLVFLWTLWAYSHRRDIHAWIILLLFSFLLLGYPLFYALSPAGWAVEGFNYDWVAGCFLVLDAIVIFALPLYAALVHHVPVHRPQQMQQQHHHHHHPQAWQQQQQQTVYASDNQPLFQQQQNGLRIVAIGEA